MTTDDARFLEGLKRWIDEHKDEREDTSEAATYSSLLRIVGELREENASLERELIKAGYAAEHPGPITFYDGEDTVERTIELEYGDDENWWRTEDDYRPIRETLYWRMKQVIDALHVSRKALKSKLADAEADLAEQKKWAERNSEEWRQRLEDAEARIREMEEILSLVKRYFSNTQWAYGMDHGYFCRECKNSPHSGHTKECAVGFIVKLATEAKR